MSKENLLTPSKEKLLTPSKEKLLAPSNENLLQPPPVNTTKKSSFAGVPCLRIDELKFFDLVVSGNVPDLEKFLEDHSTLNVNCVNYQGLSALHLAVKSEHVDIVKFLIGRPDLYLKDAVLHAVATGNIEITEIILNELNAKVPNTEALGYAESPEYSPDMTPLLIAASCGDYRMIRSLLARRHEITRPHVPDCLCSVCKALLSESGSSLPKMRLNAYKAIANPAYICQTTDDPILHSFSLDKELKKCASYDKEFRAEYTVLSQEVREFTVELVKLCRNPTEIEMILKQRAGYAGTHRDVAFPRLQLAIDYNQKEFVAQSAVQQVLNTFWLGEYTIWSRLFIINKCVRVFLRMLMLPFMAVIYLFVPSMFLSRKWKAPVNKFISSLASYVMFIVLLFTLIQLDKSRDKRGPPHTGLEAVIILYVVGFVWTTIKQAWVQGRERFFRIPWNWYDMIMEGIFLLTFALWIKSYFDAKQDKKLKGKMLERKYWHSHDATLLHEGLFAIGSILSSGRLLYYCQQSSRLGPLQVSFGKMAVQIAYFVFFAFLIIFCFAMPMSRMYKYYDGMIQTEHNTTRYQLSSFSTFTNSIMTLFWAIFGMSPVESADIIIENLKGNSSGSQINHHVFTERVGRTLFGLYELGMCIALINTLVAILTNTFQRVVDNVDVEWKFARTKLWMFYFHEATSLPSPFNLLPSPTLIFNIYTYCATCMNKIEGAKARCSVTRCCYIEYEKKDVDDPALYQELISLLIQRFFRSKGEENKEEIK